MKDIADKLKVLGVSPLGIARLKNIAEKHEQIDMSEIDKDFRDYIYELCAAGHVPVMTVMKVFRSMKLDKEAFDVVSREGFSGPARQEIFKAVFGGEVPEEQSIIIPSRLIS